MIQVQGMNYSYEGNTPVLQDITFTESEPVITGLWGRNGAGKTTFMKILAGHLRPDQGFVNIMGMSPYNNEEIMQHICYMQEEHPFGWQWTVGDALFFSRYFNPNWNQETVQDLMEIFKLEEKKKLVKLSKGMKAALQYIIGLASFAPITILDEPINGLDAAMRKKLYETVLESHAQHPRLILISTHHIQELQALFETMMVLKSGRLLLYESMDKIREGGIWLAGEKNKIEETITGQKVLEQNQVGSMMKVMMDVKFTNEWKERAQKQGLAIEKAKMQDYLLNITCHEEVS